MAMVPASPSREISWPHVVIAVVVLAFAAGCVALALPGLLEARAIAQHGISGVGIVERAEIAARGDGRPTLFTLVFAYRGDSCRLQNHHTTDAPYYRLGERVPIRFMPDNPRRAIIDSEQERYSGYLPPLVVGGLLVLLAAYQLRQAINPSRHS